MARKGFDELLAAGRGQQESSTRILLGLTDHEQVVHDAAESEPGPLEQTPLDNAPETPAEPEQQDPTAAVLVRGDVVAAATQTSKPAPDTRNRRIVQASTTQGAVGTVGRGVLDLLPAVDDVLVTGVRGGKREVRDVTYEIPAASYFAFIRLKNDLARSAHRKVTVAALIEAALKLLPDDLDVLDSEMRRLAPGEELRRLTARISEDRYRQIQGILLDLYERSGTRRSGAELWTYLVAKLLATN
jgi:hypothetical protein